MADLHLNKTVYKGVMDEELTDLPFRNADLMRAFEFAINKNVNEIHPDLAVILGDVYDSANPINPIRTFFNTQLRKLSEANIPVIILTGNHDVSSKHHALEPIAALGLKNIKVVSTPKLITFKDKVFMLFPYSLEVEKHEISIRDQFHNFVKYTHKQIELRPELQNKEIMFFGHFGVNGAIKNSYDDSESNGDHADSSEDIIAEIQKSKKVMNHDIDDITIMDLKTIGANYIFLGDYHQHQVLDTKDTVSFYIGGLEKCNFAEKNHKKGFVVYDSEMESSSIGKCNYIEYSSCRPMIELKGNYDKMLKDMEKYPESTKTLIKVYFVGDEKELLEYSVKIEDFKKKLSSKFKPLYIFSKQKLINEEAEEEASQIEKNIASQGHIGDSDVRQVVEETIKEKETNLEEQSILINMANKVYEETKEEEKR